MQDDHPDGLGVVVCPQAFARAGRAGIKKPAPANRRGFLLESRKTQPSWLRTRRIAART